MQMGLYIFAKNQEDALQIVEQILPYFNPDFSVTVNDLPELGIKRDIKIVMDSVVLKMITKVTLHLVEVSYGL